VGPRSLVRLHAKETAMRRRVLRRVGKGDLSGMAAATSSAAGRNRLFLRLLVEGVDELEGSKLSLGPFEPTTKSMLHNSVPVSEGVAPNCDGRGQQQVASIQPHLQQSGAKMSSKSKPGPSRPSRSDENVSTSPPFSKTSS
jgi:hypothetical protein